MEQLTIHFYTKTKCPLCDKAKQSLAELKEELSFQVKEHDIYQDDQLLEKYQLMIPVIEINEEIVAYGQIVKDSLKSCIISKIE